MRILIRDLYGGHPIVLDGGKEYDLDHLFDKLRGPISFKGFIESEDLYISVDIVGLRLVTRTGMYTTVTDEDLKRFNN